MLFFGIPRTQVKVTTLWLSGESQSGRTDLAWFRKSMESSSLFYLRNNRWTLHLPVNADFIGEGPVSLWWLCYVVLLHRSPFKRSPGVFRAQDWGQLRAYASPTENEAVSIFQTVLKPSSWFIFSPPSQVQLPTQLHPPKTMTLSILPLVNL